MKSVEASPKPTVSLVKQSKYAGVLKGTTFITKAFLEKGSVRGTIKEAPETYTIVSPTKQTTLRRKLGGGHSVVNNQKRYKLRRSTQGTTQLPSHSTHVDHQLDSHYIDALMNKHDRSSFMLSDIKDVNEPRNQANTMDI